MIVHEYVALDMERVIHALDDLAPTEEFANIIARLLAESEGP